MFEIPPQEPAAVASDRLTAAVPTLAALPNVVVLGYPVAGRSRRGVREQINRNRPEIHGERHDAQTQWRYSTRWRGRSGGQCLAETSEVTAAITVILPDLEDPDRLGREDRAAWDRYFAALEHHEANHVRIANEGAAQVQAAMRAAGSCDDMQAAVRRVGDMISAASEDYDRRTRHGATEGAQF